MIGSISNCAERMNGALVITAPCTNIDRSPLVGTSPSRACRIQYDPDHARVHDACSWALETPWSLHNCGRSSALPPSSPVPNPKFSDSWLVGPLVAAVAVQVKTAPSTTRCGSRTSRTCAARAGW